MYDQARKEFYDLRLQEEVRRQVAKEEAMATGAYFGKSLIEIGMELEDKQFKRLNFWVEKQTKASLHQEYAGPPAITNDPTNSTFEPEVEAEQENEVQEAETPLIV